MINKNRLIKRRRVFFIRRIIFIFLVFVLFTLIFVNSSIFNIRNIKVIGNKILSEDYILKELNSLLNKNIFFYSIKSEISELNKNKYIKNINFEKKLPNIINVMVDEVRVNYYIYANNEYYIFDEEAKLVDILDYKQDFQLIEILGSDLPNSIVIGGDLFEYGSRELGWLRNISDLVSLNKSNIKFDYVDLSNIHSVVLGYRNIKIKIGNNTDVRDKLNVAINIINSNPKFSDMVGYIDVRAKDYPVILLE